MKRCAGSRVPHLHAASVGAGHQGRASGRKEGRHEAAGEGAQHLTRNQVPKFERRCSGLDNDISGLTMIVVACSDDTLDWDLLELRPATQVPGAYGLIRTDREKPLTITRESYGVHGIAVPREAAQFL